MTSPLQARVRDLKEQSVEKLQDAKMRVVDGTRDAAKKIDREAHKRPWAFVGAAALFTTIFGFFLGRKSKRSPGTDRK